jgi:PAS domain S-box-containing protein
MSQDKFEILLIDDTATNLRLIGDMLTSEGYRVRVSQDSTSALESVFIKSPDLIMLDIRMPGMNGFELCQRLKQDERTAEIPVIFISALHEVSEMVKAFKVGGIDFISKPIQREEMLARVRAHIDMLQMRRQLEERVKERDDQLKKSYAELERRIDERTVELQRANETLKNREESISAIVSAVPDGIIAIDEQGVIDSFNPAAEEIFGYKAEEIIGRNVKLLMPEPYQSEYDSYLSNYRQSGIEKITGTVRELKGLRKDGTTFSIELTVKNMKSEGMNKFICVVRNITERKKNDEALRISTEKFSKAFSSAPDWISISILSDSIFTEVNDSFLDVTGYSREEVIGHSSIKLGLWVDIEQRKTLVRKLEAKERVRDMEIKMRMKNGTVRDFLFAAEVIEIGAIAHLFVYARDITERNQAEKKLAESETKFRNLVEGSLQGIYVHRDFKPLFANEKCAEIFWYNSPEEILELDSILDVFWAPEEQERIKGYKTRRMAGGEVPAIYEGQGMHRDGSRFWFENHVTLIDWLGEQAVQVAVIDITERKQYELNIKAAKEVAEASSKAKSQFLATMSHELMTPLNHIIGYCEILQDEITGESSDDIASIHKAGKNLHSIINNMLDLSNIDSGKMKLSSESFIASKLIASVAEQVAPTLKKNNNTLDLVCDENIGFLQADAERVQQCLFHLLHNAAKFTEGGQVSLKVFQEVFYDKEMVVFQISDTGIGISKKSQDEIFDIFTQIDSTNTRKYGGTGIGLTITHKLCQIMGGDLQVESELDKGSTFTMRLPITSVVNK